MLSQKLLIEKLDEIATNFSLEIKKGYTNFIFKALNEYNFSNEDLIFATKMIIFEEISMFSAMPNVAMFLKYKPIKKQKIEYFEALPKVKITEKEKKEGIKILQDLAKKLKNRGKRK